MQHHLRGKVAEERAGQLQRQHQREVIVGVADEHREQIANDERAAEGEQAQKHGPQRTDGDNVAAALHLRVCRNRKKANTAATRPIAAKM